MSRPLLFAAFALISAPAGAQIDTDCSTVGGVTHCRAANQPAVPNVGQQMLDNMAAQQRQQQAEQAAAAGGAAERRARAYAQVGELIAKGDCPAALRLARFYNHADILKDTRRACPEN